MASAHASCRSIAQGLIWLLAGVTVLVRGQPVYLSLSIGNTITTTITTNNTEVLITDIGDGLANPGATTLICHTNDVDCCRRQDTGLGALGKWLYPDGTEIPNTDGRQDFFIRRNDPQLIRLNRRVPPGATSPVGLYCCVIPTTMGNMTFCANLVVCPSLTTPTNGMITYVPDSPTSVGTVATYQCDSGYTLNPEGTRTCQNGGTWSGGEPTCEAVDCETPPSITNGSPGTPTSTTLGGTVTYSCNSGYTLSGSATVSCLSSGSWSTRPTCTATCDYLTPLNNGAIIYSPTSSPRPQGTTATYRCDTGYTGGTVRTCQSDRTWSGGSITCQPVDCGTPPSITNGSPGTPTSTTFGGTVTYSCSHGLVISGSSMLSCLATGMWDTPPSCLAVPPVYLSLSGTNYLTSNFEIGISSIGDTNDDALVCHSDLSTCCRASDDPPNGVGRGDWMFPNGTALPAGTSVSVSDTNIIYRTRDEAVIRLHRRGIITSPTGTYCCVIPTNGGERTFCANLVDSITTTTTPTLTTTMSPVSTCSDLPPPANGMVVYSSGSPNARPVSSTVTYSCNNGYSLNRGSTRTCQNGGTWSGGEPTCEVVDCGPPPSITNGSPGTPTSTTLGGTVTYSCSDGLILSGSATISCLATGMWDTQPSCTAVDCGPLSNPVNGQVTTLGTTFNSMATYSCDEGFNLVGSRVVTCGLDGVWTPSSPTCDAVDCGPPPSITNGSPTTPASTTFRETVVYSCSDGYIILGSTTITCLSTGSWSSPPICQPLPPVYLSLSVTKYISGISEIPLSSVGEGAGSYLTCRTDDTNCCREAESGVVGGVGAWHYPNGSVVPTSSDGGDLYISRDGPMVVNLNRRNDVMDPTGLYCCVVPTSTGTGVFCANLSGPSIGSPSSQPDNTGAIVGGVVVILLALILAIAAIVIAYLVLKQRRTGGVNLKRDIPLSDKGQSALPQTYETEDVTYEEIGGTRPLKVNCDYTQNQAYVTTTAPLRGEGVVNTGGSGNPTEDSPVGGDESMIYEN